MKSNKKGRTTKLESNLAVWNKAREMMTPDQWQQFGESEEARQIVAEIKKEDTKNYDFVMIYKKLGVRRLRELIAASSWAGQLFAYILEVMDRSNCLVASYQVLAEALDTHKSRICEAVKVLETKGFLKRYRSGMTSVFVLNPDIVWSDAGNKRKFCLFHDGKVLISKTEQERVRVQRHAVAIRAQDPATQDAEKPIPAKRKITPRKKTS